MKENLSRRQFLSILGGVAGTTLLAGCGPSPIDAGSPPSQPENQSNNSTEEVCVESYQGATVTDILSKNNKEAGTTIKMDRGNDGSIDWTGPGVQAGGLQYNEGAKALDGSQINPTIKDRICFTK